MAGELDRIGGRRGAIVLFERLIRIVLKRNIPRSIVEKLLWDLLTDMVKEAIKGDKTPAERAVIDLEPEIELAPNLNLSVPKNAVGFRWDIPIDNGVYGRIPGNGICPDNYAYNVFSDTPLWYGFGVLQGNFGASKMEFSRGLVMFSKLDRQPQRLYIYSRQGVAGKIRFLKYK